MGTIVTDAYPNDALRTGRAYTVLKKLKVEAAPVSDPYPVVVEHGLGVVPTWVRVTALRYYDETPPGTYVVGTQRVAPLFDRDATEASGELVWEAQPPGVADPIDLAQEVFVAASPDKLYDLYYLVEIGITQSASQ